MLSQSDAVFHAWQSSDPALQLTSSVTDATPTQVSEHSGFAMDKSSGDLVFAFAVMDTANRCAAGAAAIPSSAKANAAPTIFKPLTLAPGDSCNAAVALTRYAS